MRRDLSIQANKGDAFSQARQTSATHVKHIGNAVDGALTRNDLPKLLSASPCTAKKGNAEKATTPAQHAFVKNEHEFQWYRAVRLGNGSATHPIIRDSRPATGSLGTSREQAKTVFLEMTRAILKAFSVLGALAQEPHAAFGLVRCAIVSRRHRILLS